MGNFKFHFSFIQLLLVILFFSDSSCEKNELQLENKFVTNENGGEYNFSYPNFELNFKILPNTFSKEETITVEKLGSFNLTNENLKNAFTPFSYFELSSTDEEFKNPILLTINYSEGIFKDLADEELLWFFQFNPETEELISHDKLIIDHEQNTIQIELTHFSTWTIALYNFKWDVDIINYYIGPDESGVLWGERYDIISVINALESWEGYQGRFKFNRVFNESEANIIYKSVSPWIDIYQGMTSIILHFGTKDEDNQITIKINNSSEIDYWSFNDGLPIVIAHETGHALGLVHLDESPCNLPISDQEAPPMMSIPGGATGLDRKITVCDINDLQEKYGEPPYYYGKFKDYRDGHYYKWIKIESQIWMAENLAYAPNISPPTEGSVEEPFYYVYDYDGTDLDEAKSTTNFTTYGILYNWEAAKTANPNGWHIPTDEEWMQMYGYANHFSGGRVSEALKSDYGWDNGFNGTDLYGFEGLPGGFRYDNEDSFFGIGKSAYFWTTNDNYDHDLALSRYLPYSQTGAYGAVQHKEDGISIRCVKD